MKKILFLFMGLMMVSLGTYAQSTIEATPIDNLSTYTGTEPYVFDMSARKYYAYNNLNQYEEMGIYPEVSTLKVAGGGATEIEYIKTNSSMGTIPYINLNYIPKANSKAVATMIAETGADWKAAYGCGYYQNGWKDRFCFFTTNATINLGGETGNSAAMRYGEKIVTVLDAVAGKMDIYEADGTTLIGTITDSPKTADCKTPLYVFAQNKDVPGGGTLTDCYNPGLTLYSLQLYEGETLVMDLVPVVDAEGKGGLKDKLTGTIYTSANSGEFELSPDGQAIAADAGISVYPGKLVINTSDNHEYKWDGTQWVDLGSVYEPISETGYQNMNNWTCRFGYESTYDNIENTNGNDNFFNPYKGEGGWEPYQYKLTGLTRGETYRVSFNFTSGGWNSWSNYATLPFFVSNNWDFGREVYPTSAGGEILGVVGLPQPAMNNHPYSFNFVADGTEATMAIQFGVGDDAPNLYFHFDDLMVELVNYPEKYDLTWVDPNKYTPLEYIESTGAARENAYTTPYIAKASTEIDIKFQSYSGGDWRAIFSGRNGSDAGNGISLYQNGDQAHFGYFVGGYRQDNHADYPGHNQDITVAATLGNLNVNGTDYPTGQTSFNASTRKISLFANPEWDNAFRGRIYYFNISENGEAVYNFNPVMRHDGVFGYYDAATATFVIPAQGHLTGYGYKLLDNAAYVLYPTDTRICIVGMTAKFLPTVQNLDNPTFTWTSADPNIATVAADGTVTGVAPGKVKITATTDADEGWTATYELTVSEPNYLRRDVNNVGYAILTGGNGWGDSPLSALLDNNANTKFGCSGSGDAWAIMIASEPVAVSQYSFVTGGDTYNYPARNPRTWKLEGSNDNQTWTVIDEHNDFDAYKIHSVNKEEFVFPVNGTDTYKFFKLSATVGDGFQLGEFWINEQSHNWGEATVTAATCTVEGKSEQECSDCHALKTTVLPLAAHTYVDGVCSVCDAKAYEVVLLPDGQTNPYAVKFRHMNGSDNPIDIETGWNTVAFDDSAWDELIMPIGSNGYDNGPRQGAQYNTVWFNEYNTYWFRRTFDVADPSQVSTLVLKILHDDNMWAYVNGTMVRECPGGNDWTDGTGWREIVIDPSLLVQGENVIAICIEQNWGGAYCDFSLEATLAANVTIGPALYATYVAPVDITTIGSDVKAFTVELDHVEANWVRMTQVTEVPAGTPVVVGADAAGTYPVLISAGVSALTNNILQVAADNMVADAEMSYYGLFNYPEKKGVGFYPLIQGANIPKGKVYFHLTSSGAKDFYALFEDDVNGIEGVIIDYLDGTQEIYNIRGQKLNKLERGVNIVNGKKVVVK